MKNSFFSFVCTILLLGLFAYRCSATEELLISATDSNSHIGNYVAAESRWDNLGVLHGEKGTVNWKFKIETAGTYHVQSLYASGEQRPCTLTFKNANSEKTGKSFEAIDVFAEPTGGFFAANLQWVTLGQFELSAGEWTMTLAPQRFMPHIRGFRITTDTALPTKDIFLEQQRKKMREEDIPKMAATREELQQLLPDASAVLFIKRATFQSSHYYTDFIDGCVYFGSELCLLSLKDGTIQNLVPELASGIIGRCNLSFDGRKVIFDYKAKLGEGFRIWEVDIDGTNLRQLTFPPEDEAARIAKYRQHWHPMYFHHTDDMHPTYLPDGGFCFVSTRCEFGVLCDGPDILTVSVLYRADENGKNLKKLSNSSLSESAPSITNDGRIMYTRWEYIDNGSVTNKGLWSMRSDGTGSADVYGRNMVFPSVFNVGRAVPGSNSQFVCIGAPHMPLGVGTILLLDTTKDPRTSDPVTYLTPEVDTQHQWGWDNVPGGATKPFRPDGLIQTSMAFDGSGNTSKGPLFMDPFPIDVQRIRGNELNQTIEQTMEEGGIVLFNTISAEGSNKSKDAYLIGPGGGGTLWRPEINPQDSNNIFTSCEMGSTFISRDGGESFDSFNFLVGASNVILYFFSPHNANTVYAVSQSGHQVFKSNDQGYSWDFFAPKREHIDISKGNITYPDFQKHFLFSGRSNVVVTRHSLLGVYVHPTEPDTIFIAARGSNVWLTDTPTGNGSKNLTEVYRSTDGGNTFTRLSVILDADSPNTLNHNRFARMKMHDGYLHLITTAGIFVIDLKITDIYNNAVYKRIINANTDSGAVIDSRFLQDGTNFFVYANVEKKSAEATWNEIRKYRYVNTEGRYDHDNNVVITKNFKDNLATWDGEKNTLSGGTPARHHFFDVVKNNAGSITIYVNFLNAGTTVTNYNAYGVAVSHDDGQTWKRAIEGTTIGIDNPENSNTLFSRVPNLGPIDTWYRDFSYSGFARGVVINPRDSNHAIVTGSTDGWQTRDGGKTWASLSSRRVDNGRKPIPLANQTPRWKTTGIDPTVVEDFAVDPHNPNHWFAGMTDAGLYESFDAGESWTRRNFSRNAGVWGFAHAALGQSNCNAIAFSPHTKDMIIAGMTSVHDLRYVGNPSNTGPMLYITYSNPESGTGTGGSPFGYLITSTDGGKTWKTGTIRDNATLRGKPVTFNSLQLKIIPIDIVFDPLAPGTAYAAVYNLGVLKTTDNGANWGFCNEGIDVQEYRGNNGTSTPVLVIASRRMTLSQDGKTLFLMLRGMTNATSTPNTNLVGPTYSLDLASPASTWKKLNIPGDVEGTNPAWNGTVLHGIDKDKHGVLYAVPARRMESPGLGGAYVSLDNGTKWRQIFDVSRQVVDIKISDHNPDVLYIITNTGQVYTSDKGKITMPDHWKPMPFPPISPLYAIHEVPHDRTRILVSTHGGGLWVVPIPGVIGSPLSAKFAQTETLVANNFAAEETDTNMKMIHANKETDTITLLASYNPDKTWNTVDAYGLYLIDGNGNRKLLHREEGTSCWNPIPVMQRDVHRGSSGGIINPTLAEKGLAQLVVTDVHVGLDGVAPGTVKYIRINEQVPRPWAARRFWSGDEHDQQHSVITDKTHLGLKTQIGIVPVESDGSANFLVPADKNIFFQVLDENFMEVQRERTFVNYRPGEVRSCAGCHENVETPGQTRVPIAIRRAPSEPGPQPGEASGYRALHYPTDVQPFLDKYCISCHGAENPQGKLNLTGELTERFCRSYEELMRRNIFPMIRENYPKAGNNHYVPPYTLGSHASKLFRRITDTESPCFVEPTFEERIRLTTWIESNGQYYGTYFGKKNIRYKDDQDFRIVPEL